MATETEMVKAFCEEVNESSSQMKIYYTSFDGMAIGYRDLRAQIGDGIMVANRIEEFLNNSVFCDKCGDLITKLKENSLVIEGGEQ